jgi:hypothetical protein
MSSDATANLAVYLGLLHTAEDTLADSFIQVSEGHQADADVYHICRQLAGQCGQHVEALEPIVSRYGERRQSEPERLHAEGLSETRAGPVGLLRDLQDLYLLASLVDITWTMIGQAARDADLLDVATACQQQTSTQIAWLRTRMKQAAPQALLVAE